MATQANFKIVELFAAARKSSSATGSDVDLKGYINPGGRQMKAFLSVTGVSGTSPTLDVKIQEADATSTYTDITSASFTQLTTTGSQEIHFRTNKRYVRAIATLAGTSPVFDAATLLLVEKRQT